MKDYQRTRIRVLLGVEEDRDASYNVTQSKIAIGSGGLLGKGFMNGTQTKLDYVPEQDTDFIFCTVGEEEGFVGAAGVLVLFLLLIWRLIALAERQTSTFGRVFGYSVLSILLFHVFINIGMVLGIAPRHRHPAAVLFLRRLVALGFHAPAFHLPAHRRRTQTAEAPNTIFPSSHSLSIHNGAAAHEALAPPRPHRASVDPFRAVLLHKT